MQLQPGIGLIVHVQRHRKPRQQLSPDSHSLVSVECDGPNKSASLFSVSVEANEKRRLTVPLTSYPGVEEWPSFSLDGSQVAFSWNGDKQDNYDIYVKLIGT